MSEVTVIIPNYNGLDCLKICLASLMQQKNAAFDILVVDNGSTDESTSWLQTTYPRVGLLVLDKNYGFSVAVNKGIQAVKTPYVILLNNDTKAEPEFVSALLAEIKKSEKTFSCQAKMLDYYQPQLMDDAGDFYCALGWAFARGKGREEEHYQRPYRIFASCAGAAIYRTEIFHEIGYFDERHFAYLEDIDVGYRAKIYGYSNSFCPAARVYHMGSATTGSRYNQWKVRLSAQNSVYLAYKNMPIVQLIFNSPLLVLGILLKLLFFTRKGFGGEFKKGISQGLTLCKKERKVKYAGRHFVNYIKIQLELWKNLGIRLRKF